MIANCKRPRWDIHEAVILLDGYIGLKENKLSNASSIENISSELRTLAVARGYNIDSAFRNEKSIYYQLQSMEAAFNRDDDSSIPPTQLFREAVDMYQNDPQRYNSILSESKKLICDWKCHSSSKDNEVNNPSHVTQISYSKDMLEATEVILSVTFSNGMRLNSSIAKKKFASAYQEFTGELLSNSIDIDALIANVGVEYGGKIYAITLEQKEHIKKLILDALESGNSIIFYEDFFNHYSDLFSSYNIFSSEMLKCIIKRLMPNLAFRRSSFSLLQSDTLDETIRNSFKGDFSLTCEEMHERLPFIPLAQIKVTCSGNEKFTHIGCATYSLTEQIEISKDDVEASEVQIRQDIADHNFSVINRIIIDKSKQLFPAIPDKALKEALFSKYLSCQFSRQRTLITLPGEELSAPDVMRSYCSKLNIANVFELQNYEISIMDKALYYLTAAYETMIRISQDTFVGKNKICFNIEAVDNAIELFSQGKIIPITSIQSFSSFPNVVGYVWNSFLLDSYCKHISHGFKSLGGAGKIHPVGAIFPSTMKINSYQELLAKVVVQEKIELKSEEINSFLLSHSYILRHIEVDNIIKLAQKFLLQEDTTNV